MKQYYRLFVLMGILLVTMLNAHAEIINAGNKNNKTVLQGVVTDKYSGEVLAGVSVKLDETGEVAYTDFDGNFTFENIEPGSYNISVSYISYQDKTEKGVKTKLPDKELVEIKMNRQ